MLDKYDEFFLGNNVNEPVALEIPVKTDNINDLQRFLESLGFEITNSGAEKDKILIDKHKDFQDTYPIITPALRPEDRKKIWEALKYALEVYHDLLWKDKGELCSFMYPHLLDLQNLVTRRRQLPARKPEDDRKIINLLRELERSSDVIKLNRSEYHGHQLKELGIFNPRSLVNGSTLPDPYSVATGNAGRFVRYASTDIGYAFGYSNVRGSKSINPYENFSPDMRNRIGFVFEYERNPKKQIFFQNTGIEYEHGEAGEGEDDETVITRFDNPCIGIYVTWSSVDKTGKYTYMYKLDENDPRYQLLKEYYSPSNSNLSYAKNERFEAWNNENGEHQTYMPVANIDQVKSKADALLNKVETEKKRYEDIQTEIYNDIYSQINAIKTKFTVYTPRKYTEILDIIENEQLLLSIETECNASILQLNKIKERVSELKNEIANNEKFKSMYWNPIVTQEEEVDKKIKACKETIQTIKDCKTKNTRYIKKDIEDLISGNYLADNKFYVDIPQNIRVDILNEILSDAYYIKSKPGVVADVMLNLYVNAPSDDKAELFDLLYKIRQTATKDFRKSVQNRIKRMSIKEDMDKEVLTELFKRDNIFVKHTERARNKMQFLIGQAKIKQMAQMNQIANQQAMDLENEG